MGMGDTAPAWLRRRVESRTDNVGVVIREQRRALGMSQTAVAGALSMTQQFLSQIENGSRSVNFEQRRKLSQVLDIAPERLGIAGTPHSASAFDDRAPAISVSRGLWRAQRAWLNQHRFELAQLAAEWYAPEYRVSRTPLVAAPEWIPTEPIDIKDLQLSLDESEQHVSITGRERESLTVRPLRSDDAHFDSYTAAIKHLEPPQLFESRPSYRFLGGSCVDRKMSFGLAAYFDKLDTAEALGHEMAVVCSDGLPDKVAELRGRLPFRELIADPFDPQTRAIVPAITTLTIRLRRYPEPPSFLLHWRDPVKVATAAGVYDVIPAGEFQPSSVALWDRGNDFSLWRNMVREYSEELLGAPEHDGTRTEPIDYESWSLFQALERAKRDGAVSAHVLGMALDALTLAATILTVVVIDDDVFDDLFGATVRFNDEGEIVAIGDGRSADGIPFTEEAVTRLLESEPLASPGAGCLTLAWRHRHMIIG